MAAVFIFTNDQALTAIGSEANAFSKRSVRYHKRFTNVNSTSLQRSVIRYHPWYHPAMTNRGDSGNKRPKYESVSLSELRQGRLGKHHELVENILRQLKDLPEGEAIKIPLDSVIGLTKANLRSALVRAASSRATPLSTYSDRDNFYVWNRTRSTAKYERKRKGLKTQH